MDKLERLAAANPCLECGSENVTARSVVTRSWRGIVIECLDCGTETEYDEWEPPADPRGI